MTESLLNNSICNNNALMRNSVVCSSGAFSLLYATFVLKKNNRLPSESKLASSISIFFYRPTTCPTRKAKIFMGQMSIQSPNQQCESTEGKTKHRLPRWPGLIFSSSTTGLITERAFLLPLR